MKTDKPLNERYPRKQGPTKAVQMPDKTFRHRDRGIHTGRTKGA